MKKIILVGTISGALILSSILSSFASEDKNERWSKILLINEDVQKHREEIQLTRDEINVLRSEKKDVLKEIASLKDEKYKEVKTQINNLNNQITQLIKKMQEGQIAKGDFKVQLKNLKNQKVELKESIRPVKEQIVPLKENRKEIHGSIQAKKNEKNDKNTQFKSDIKQKRDELKNNN